MTGTENGSIDEEIARAETAKPAESGFGRERCDVVHERRASEILTRLATAPGERLSVASALEILEGRSLALFIVLLGLANCVPMPPPVPTASGLLLIVVAVQIAAGRSAPWLPAYVLRGSIAKENIARAVAKALPHVLRLERWAKPRLWWHGPRAATLLTGLLLVILALGILTAAPLVGYIPFGIAVCLVGLGFVEHDGMLVAGGVLAGSFGALVSASFIYAVIATVRSFL